MSIPPTPLPTLAPDSPRAPAMLLAVRGRPLMAWCLQRMAEGGLSDVVINTG
ncbi:MAG: hypothetical protein RIR43_862, partial [Pseudomonadota bacterium]